MKEDLAKQISAMMLSYGARLDESVRLVMNNGSKEEFESYRKAVGQVMGTMLLDIMNPLYREHPDLKPKELE